MKGIFDMLNEQTPVDLVRLVTAGSVDDGKSTLIGRLLFDCHAIASDQMAAVKRASERRGLQEMDLSLLTDGLLAEREQGITIDVAYRYFARPSRRFVIADVPGHEQYTKNMVTGASTADIAMLLVDAHRGFSIQSKRHLSVVSLLRIPHIVILINKMDTVDFDQQQFNTMQREVSDFAKKLQIFDLQFIPLSALTGDMVAHRGSKMPWYDGPTVLSYLENVQVAPDRNLIDFRLPIQTVLRPAGDKRRYAGRVEAGRVKIGEEILVLPSQRTSSITGLYVGDEPRDAVEVSESISLTLADELDISRGEMLVRPHNKTHVSNNFEATLCWIDDVPVSETKTYILQHTTRRVRCQIYHVKYRLNIDTLHREDGGLALNDIGKVAIRTAQPLMFDPYAKSKYTGSFILIDPSTKRTVAAGLIGRKIEGQSKASRDREICKQAVHAPVLWFTGLSGSGKSTLAQAVAKRLQSRGITCQQLDGDIMRTSPLGDELGFSKEDRLRNVLRAGYVANMLASNGVVALCSFISPYQKVRAQLRDMCEDFVEIHVSTPLDVCESRDVKGLYAKARCGDIKQFTGVSDPYEVPEQPELCIDTTDLSIDTAVEMVLAYMKENGYGS